MSNDEKYALNWSSHADHIKTAFHAILQKNDFVDVTLSCEGKKLKAHRVILSACSTYFYDILKDNPCSHPTIVLRDLKYSNIKDLINFMYCGEVQVPIENFSSFLQTAEILQISGLTGNQNDEDTKSKTKQEDNSVSNEKLKSSFKALKSSSIINKRRRSSVDEKLSSKKKKGSDLSHSEDEGDLSGTDSKEDNEVNQDVSMSKVNITNIQKLLNDSTYLSKDANPECECPVCAEKFDTHYLLKQHVPFHLGETKCLICGQIWNRMDLLKKHMLSAHKIVSSSKRDR